MLTDQTMPDLTGDALARAVLAVRPDLPVILCSGYSEHYQITDAARDGIVEFLAKPIDRQHLGLLLQRVARGLS